MLRYLLSLVALFFCLNEVSAQNIYSEVGARAAALAYSTSAESGLWSAYNNPAGLYPIKQMSFGFSAQNRFHLEGLNTASFACASPFIQGGAGITITKFGDDIYNEQSIALSFAHKLGMTSLGLRVNYTQYQMESLGSKGIISVDLGGRASLSENLHFGAYIRNINQSKLSEFEDEYLPILLYAGISYLPTDKITLNAEVEKDIDYDSTLKLGLEYTFLKKFNVRTGVKTFPFSQHFGLGFNSAKVHIDYALNSHQSLGLNHQISIQYSLRKK